MNAQDASCLDRVGRIHQLEVQMGGGRVAGASCHGNVSGGAPALRRPVRAGVRFASSTHARGLVLPGSLAGVPPRRSEVEVLIVGR